MGLILTAKSELTRVRIYMDKWEKGDLTTSETALLIKRTARKLDKACFCQEGVCCGIHDKHSSPHMNCILR